MPCRTRVSASSARRKRKMASGADRRLFWATAAGVVALDIVTKIVAVAPLARRPLELVGDYVVLRLVYNRGAAFGLDLGDASRWIFLGLAIVALVVLGLMVRATRAGDKLRLLALALVCGGGVGHINGPPPSAQAARLIADKRVTAAGRPLRASALLERGAEVSVELPPEAPPRTYSPVTPPQAGAGVRFVYEDEHLAVLDKPAGLVVHPGPGHWDDTLVNVLVERGTALAQGATAGRPGIVHRLDRDTSGLLLVAKTDLAHRRLTRMIERREVERVYAALAWGHFAKSPVDIEAPITRHPTDRKRMTVLAGGRHAVTHVRVTARFAQTDLLRVTLGTGRTHQIRVHLAHVGHPVVGDREYAFGGSRRVTPSERQTAERLEALAPRQLLHAARLAFAHPVSGARLDLRSEWPAGLVPALRGAAADLNLLAQRNPLQYLGFFASDE